MTKPEVLQETPVSMVEMKEELTKIRKKSEELNFRAERTEEYLNMFVHFDEKKAKELREGLEKLKIPRLKEEHTIKIMDVLPTTPEGVKSLISAYTITITNDNLKKIAEVVKGFTE